MKKLLYLLLAMISIAGFTSCGSDDVEANEIQYTTWVSEKTVSYYDGKEEFVLMISFSKNDCSISRLNSCYFSKENPTLSDYYMDLSQNRKFVGESCAYTISGNTLRIEGYKETIIKDDVMYFDLGDKVEYNKVQRLNKIK